MASIVAIIGSSNSGKTTLIEKLIPELKSRGYRVATVKHAHHGVILDEPGKDSWRHIQAGSEATALISQDRLMLIKPVTPDITLDEISQLFGEDSDIILAEGFKLDTAAKIEVHRRESGPPLKDIEKLVAIVTDEPLETEIRQISLEDIRGLADFIEEGFIRPGEDRLSLYINNKSVSLKDFPVAIFINILMGMAASLRGVGKVSNLKLFLRKKD
ncbi:MAG: molybdopterin-guanine dinucleotide biosynthesis protein B [Dehalococcoidales bacterium]